ncbi:MAG: Rossmann-like and DUF2520 domain-containing protein [Candidatus Acidiferrales bacterium]|jgi:predicted short-subunit dehydrogenase-like oxidoreductase (DUF2520 family)
MTRVVAIVGAGRVGRAFGKRLRELGWRVGSVITQSEATSRAAVRAIRGGQPHASLTRQVLAADLVLIAVPDRMLGEVATALAGIGGEEWRGKIVLHTSGALDSSPLEPLKQLGAATGSLHPLQTFSGRNAPSLEGVVFAVEGSPAALRAARQIARALGGTAAQVDGRQKPAYHAAGVFVAGHALALVEAGTRMLVSLGFSRRQAGRALLPLVRQTLRNFELLGAGAAWTGPLARGDYETIALHLAALEEFPPEYRQAYEALSRLGARVLAREPEKALAALDAVFAKTPAPRLHKGGEKH